MHQNEVSLRVELENQAPRSNAAAEQTPVLPFQSSDVSGERIRFHPVEGGVDPLSISRRHRSERALCRSSE